MMRSHILRYLIGGLLLSNFITLVQTQQSCPRPDIPVDGYYRPQQSKFLLGDEVTYLCNENFLLMGKETRKCKYNGAWSDKTPFCERPVNLKNPQIKSRRFSNYIGNIIDGSTSTCFFWRSDPGDEIQLYLDKQFIIHTVRLSSEKSYINVGIFANKTMKSPCGKLDRFIDRKQWVSIKMTERDVLADTIYIRNMAARDTNITICEIQVYAKDEFGCEDPPEFTISNGYFNVSRNKATLLCEEGYESKNSRIACEGSTWRSLNPECRELLCEPNVTNTTLPAGSGWKFLDKVSKLAVGTRRQLQCNSGYRIIGGPEKVICQKNGTWTKTNATCKEEKKPKASPRTIVIGAVGVTVVIIIFILLGITIYLVKKQRHREVVVVFKPSADGSISSGMDPDYATVHYETIQCNKPVPPTTSRPAILPPMLNETYILPEDGKGTLKKQRQMPADIAFGTLKNSSLYGT